MTNYDKINAELSALTEQARLRREAAQDPCIKALRPSEIEWMTPDEFEKWTQLQFELIKNSPTLKEIQQAVREKRFMRVKGQQ